MRNFNIFIVRALMGAVFSVILIRMFHRDATIYHMGGLAVCLVGGAYLLEFWRQRKTK